MNEITASKIQVFTWCGNKPGYEKKEGFFHENIEHSAAFCHSADGKKRI
jgi:hypothetical protein